MSLVVVNDRTLYSSSDLNVELPRKFCYHLVCQAKMERKLVATQASYRDKPCIGGFLWWLSGQAQIRQRKASWPFLPGPS